MDYIRGLEAYQDSREAAITLGSYIRKVRWNSQRTSEADQKSMSAEGEKRRSFCCVCI